MACHSTVVWEDAPVTLAAFAVVYTVICFSSFVGLSSYLVMKDQMEVCPLSRGVMSTLPGLRLNSYPPHYRTTFAFSILLYPQPHRLTLRLAFPVSGEVTGLPRSTYIPSDGLGAVYPPVELHLRQEISKFLNLSTCFFAQAYQRLWLVANHDVYRQFTYVHHTIHPSSRPP